MKVYLVDWS